MNFLLGAYSSELFFFPFLFNVMHAFIFVVSVTTYIDNEQCVFFFFFFTRISFLMRGW